jgi:hypothetical protein
VAELTPEQKQLLLWLRRLLSLKADSAPTPEAFLLSRFLADLGTLLGPRLEELISRIPPSAVRADAAALSCRLAELAGLAVVAREEALRAGLEPVEASPSGILREVLGG